MGLGALTPNTVLMGWPREVTEASLRLNSNSTAEQREDAMRNRRQARGQGLMDTITTCALTQKTLIVAKGFDANCASFLLLLSSQHQWALH